MGAEADFEPLLYGVMPVAAKGIEPDQMLTLQLVSQAFEDAGISPDAFVHRERTAVIFGRGGYPGITTAAAFQHARTTYQITESLRALLPQISELQLAEIKAHLNAQAGPYGSDMIMGLVPNLVASRVANRFDLSGSAYTVDAACASSLVALEHSVRELISGTADVVITGGIHLCDDLYFWNAFSRLGAISRSQQIRPLDRRADGLLIGEGIGVLILKRLTDAQRDGDRVYATVRGVGVASDGRARSLMQPSAGGQLLALKRAWREAGIDPQSIGLLEAHGTGTPQGDRVELTTIRQFFGRQLPRLPVIGSVKSMIGHAMPASGSASLIKTALAIHDRFLPPTLHCEEPHPLLVETGFRVLSRGEPWEDKRSLCAAINAFGFGGIDAHVVLEAFDTPQTEAMSRVPLMRPPDVWLIESNDAEAMICALKEGHWGASNGHHRLALENPTPERIELAIKVVSRGMPWRGRNGIWYSPDGLIKRGGRIIFMYPGLDGRFEPRIDDVAHNFNWAPPPLHNTQDSLVGISTGIVALGRWFTKVLIDLGIRPEAVGGHSIGEWTAMVIAGITSQEDADTFIERMAPSLEVAVPGVAFAAAGCPVEVAHEAIAGLERISVSHDNCPHQVILCGTDTSIGEAAQRLRAKGVLTEILPFRSGFHSHLFREFVAPLWRHFAGFQVNAAALSIWSATTVSTYPQDPQQIKKLFVEHLVQPVRFRELTERLFAEGFSIFIQVGTGRLVGFIDDTLKNQDHIAISVCEAGVPGMRQLRRLVAGLWCEGADINLERLGLRLKPTPHTVTAPREVIKLPLAAPLVKITHAFDSNAASPIPSLAPYLIDAQAHEYDPIMREFVRVQADIAAASNEVMAAWERRSPATRRQNPLERRQVVFKQRYSLEEMPELIDHCFVPVPEGWRVFRDRFPVVPMASSLEKLLSLAQELVPELIPVAMERIRALRWMEVEPAMDIEITAEFDGVDRIQMRIGDYFHATVIMADRYAMAPIPQAVYTGPIEVPPIGAQAFYGERWNFHGPRYQSVLSVDAAGREGLLATVVRTDAPGSLVDASGQLTGYWVGAFCKTARVALPFRMDRIEFFGPPPDVGRPMICSQQLRELTEGSIRVDQEIYEDNQVWVRITGRVDNRFEINTPMRQVMAFPGNYAYGEMRPGGYCIAVESWRTSATRYFVARVYLDSEERFEYERKYGPDQRAWLLGRIAAKDAVRQVLWRSGMDKVFPVQIHLTNNADGRPIATGPWKRDLRLSIAHKSTVAAAIVAEGIDVGIDIEFIQPRDQAFLATAFTRDELALLPATEFDVWVTRAWVAKEAAAKARGAGLCCGPLAVALTGIDDERVCVGGQWIETRQEGDHVVGWTDVPTIGGAGGEGA